MDQLSEDVCFGQGEFDDDAFERLGDTIALLDEQRGVITRLILNPAEGF